MPTHINVYQEATVALAKVRDALGEAESKVEALVAQVDEVINPAPSDTSSEEVTEPAPKKTAKKKS